MATLLSWLGRTDLDQMKLDKPASIATIALKGKTLDSIIIPICRYQFSGVSNFRSVMKKASKYTLFHLHSTCTKST
ncbi:hypothetical protein DVZ93_12505 [Vibrio cholerae]|nr:hypothetical protein [Vibrio cholerae]